MSYFKKIIYGRDYDFLFKIDRALAIFKSANAFTEAPKKTNEQMMHGPADLSSQMTDVVDQLENDGFIKRGPNYTSITIKGQRFLHKGGYRSQALRKRLAWLLVIVGGISAVLSIVGYVAKA